MIIDFSAEWCAPCREMDEITFRDADVVKEAEKSFIMVKVDLTRNDAGHERLVARYRVRGVPTVIFLDGQGRERPDLRLVDFVPPNQLLVGMARVRHAMGSGPQKEM